MQLVIRPARSDEQEILQRLMTHSVRELSRGHYTEQQVESALVYMFGIDSEIVADGTYYVVESEGALVGCGGWSMRRTLFGGNQCAYREAGFLNPEKEPGKIRAFFVHPQYARRGIGRALLEHCEAQARGRRFGALEMMATLPGVKLYERFGYTPGVPETFLLPDGVSFSMVPMVKTL